MRTLSGGHRPISITPVGLGGFSQLAEPSACNRQIDKKLKGLFRCDAAHPIGNRKQANTPERTRAARGDPLSPEVVAGIMAARPSRPKKPPAGFPPGGGQLQPAPAQPRTT